MEAALPLGLECEATRRILPGFEPFVYRNALP